MLDFIITDSNYIYQHFMY